MGGTDGRPGLRLVTDSSVFFDGLWVDDAAIDGNVISDGSDPLVSAVPEAFSPLVERLGS
ncbi:MAG: hypothetical protein H0W82_02370 [Actinobacteria bacterium]|nr:hypothetical protein [Actinomycetota bacterium]